MYIAQQRGIKKYKVVLTGGNGKTNDEVKNPINQDEVYLFENIEECRRVDQIISEGIEGVSVKGYVSHSIKDIGNDSLRNRTIVSLTKAEKELKCDENLAMLAISGRYGFNAVTNLNVDEDILNSDQFYVCSKAQLQNIS